MSEQTWEDFLPKIKRIRDYCDEHPDGVVIVGNRCFLKPLAVKKALNDLSIRTHLDATNKVDELFLIILMDIGEVPS